MYLDVNSSTCGLVFSLCAWKCCWILFGDKTRYHHTAKVFDIHPSSGVNCVFIWSNNMCVRTWVLVPHDGFGSKTCHYDDFRFFPILLLLLPTVVRSGPFQSCSVRSQCTLFRFYFFCLFFQIASIQCIERKCYSNLFCCATMACRWTEERSPSMLWLSCCSVISFCLSMPLIWFIYCIHILSVFMGLCARVRVGMCLCGASECGESWHTHKPAERRNETERKKNTKLVWEKRQRIDIGEPVVSRVSVVGFCTSALSVRLFVRKIHIDRFHREYIHFVRRKNNIQERKKLLQSQAVVLEHRIIQIEIESGNKK